MKAITYHKSKSLLLRKITLLCCLTVFFSGLSAQQVEILGNAKVTGQLEIMDTILFSDGSALASACLQILADADSDTKIQVERFPDEDLIRLTSNGKEVMIIDERRLRLIHNTNSIFIGSSTGKNDDGGNANLFIGNEAGAENTNGARNTYIGHDAGTSNINGFHNTYIGSGAGANGQGGQNTFIGFRTGQDNSGEYNTLIGANAGGQSSGNKNVFIGTNAGYTSTESGMLIIDNRDRESPFIYGNFSNNTLDFDANVKVKRDLNVENEITIADASAYRGLKLGFGEEALFGIVGQKITLPSNPPINLEWMHFGVSNEGDFSPALSLNKFGSIGVGTLTPQTKFDVVSSNPIGHIMKIENTAPGIEGDGLEIKLNRPNNGAGNNFITFNDQDGVAGRIEGFSITEDISMASFPEIDFTDYFDIVSIQNLVFDRGSLPSLSGGQLPYLSGGSFPNFNPGQFPIFNAGTPASLNNGSVGSFSLDFNGDAFIQNLLCGPFCPTPPVDFYTFEWTGFSFPTLNPGNLPYISGGQLPSLSGGSFPTLNPGQLPTLSGGRLPYLDFDIFFDPTPIAGAFTDLKEVMCWALENGERSLITTNPQDIALLKDQAFLNNLADCKNGGVTYGSGGADYAEYLLREDINEHIEDGQIVGVKGGKITKVTEGAEQLLVISMMPIVLGNMPSDTLSLDQYEKVAFLGQAPVWVVGKVRSGDYIIPSGRHDGYGLAVAPEELKLEHVSTIVGRAWSDGDQSVNLVNMIIGLKTNEMATILSRTSAKVDALENRMAQIETVLGINETAEN
ncbi:hypothetical protein [Portibacter lacus]|nr:hypothetical protein [Portibacter lacus]